MNTWTKPRQGRRGQISSSTSSESGLQGRVAFAWRAMDAFYEEDERILGHAADNYHRIDIRRTLERLLEKFIDSFPWQGSI